MQRFWRARLALFGFGLFGLLLPGCDEAAFVGGKQDAGKPPPGKEAGVKKDGSVWTDSFSWKCQPNKDADGDRIPDDVEGCKGDKDGDKVPDYADTDADGDKVPDSVEAGPDPKNPRDSDGDKTPDYKDTNSDDDGLSDGKEDHNGDGQLGCCLHKCNAPHATWQKANCKLTKDGCGAGQTCTGGLCQPSGHFLCSNGETSPTKKSTFDDGVHDQNRPTFICLKAGETGGKGLKQMKLRTSTAGQWHVALEPNATYGEFVIKGAKAKEAGATFDLTGSNQIVAGFIISKPTTETDPSRLTSDIMTLVSTKLPGRAAVAQISSGNPATSHDRFSTVLGIQLELTMTKASPVLNVRNALIPTLLGRGAGDISNLPLKGFGPQPNPTKFMLKMQVLSRKDGRVLIMGGVGASSYTIDPTKNTGFHLDDLSNGSGLATTSDKDTIECDVFTLSRTSSADIIWVVDESGSMDDNRLDVANNAKDFFARAVKSGLDFRMAVTGVSSGTSNGYFPGKFCSRISNDIKDSGGTDRFLLPTEQSIFESCVKNPPGYEGGSEYGIVNAYEAVNKHLPRTANNPSKIRPGAALVIIIATDELPQSMVPVFPPDIFLQMELSACKLSATRTAWVKNRYKLDLSLYTGKHAKWGTQGLAVMHVIGGACNNTCKADVAHGYLEISQALGGQAGDVCQKNLGKTLQVIIDSISGAASPAVLEYVPISASLAVALGPKQLSRSRVKGFDYNGKSNSLIFINTPYKKGDQMAASYRRWVKQAIIK